MSSQLVHAFLADSATKTDETEPALLWKVVLRTGTWKLRPGPGGVKLKAPLKIYRDKAPKGHISMSSLVNNFNAGAKEYVTVPQVHADGTVSDGGFVKKLVIQDVAGEDGSKKKESLLWAGLEITDSELKRKLDEKSIRGVSGGILFDYEETEGGKKFDQILSHVMVTNSPWIGKTGDFTDKLPEGVMAAEDAKIPVGEVELESPEIGEDAPAFLLGMADPENDPAKKPQPPSGETVWKPEEGFQFAKGRVQKALEDWRRQVLAGLPESDRYKLDWPYYHVDDIQADEKGGKALIGSGYGTEKEAWVVSFRYTDDSVELDAFKDWTPVKQEWVAASEEQPTPAPKPSARPAGRDRQGPSRTVDSLSSLAGLGLREAQAARAERFGVGDRSTTGGARMGKISDLLARNGVQLSDLSEEQRADIEREEREAEAQQARLANFEKEQKEASIAPMLSDLEKAGLGDPGVQRYVRAVCLGDDQAPVIELSEELDGGQKTAPVQMTATEIIKGFIDRIPKDDKGRVSLSEQARETPGDEKPPAEPEKKDQELDPSKASERADALAAQLSESGFDASQFVTSSNGGGS